MKLEHLDGQLLEAHEADNKAALVDLYHQAGNLMLDMGDVNAGCFYLTHAYIFALDVGSSAANDIHQILVQHGREE